MAQNFGRGNRSKHSSFWQPTSFQQMSAGTGSGRAGEPALRVRSQPPILSGTVDDWNVNTSQPFSASGGLIKGGHASPSLKRISA